ncbi:SPL family radical SAM protein [Alkaliphilus peptidifermentans]|uniref:DNA repair photolyase n=1 Tax=Alkaliphilus peptidifermentans DSM 18978 TaxID=1120976 RepID=A0A1G5J0X4_9FIRM|nr:radical SAM protein [Alkaliphilus peptidifermentans]SCY81942.1 DNA repair photolyase [Alkaliphilus peptidifermentans DSM 18978]
MHYKEYKSILSPKNGMNIYRGCSHGCIYCDSRSKCYQMKHQFEDIEVKKNAPQMLEMELLRKRKKCMVGTGAMGDPYIELEEKLCYTRQCIEIIDRYGFGLAIQTKSNRILRDIDLLKSINKKSKCVVQLTLTTYDEDMCRIIEPNVSTTKERFEALKIFRDNGIPTVVWLTPFLPYINDTEENIRGLLKYCIEAKVYGIISFGIGLTLREGNREFFYNKLDEKFPQLKQKYIDKFGYSYICNSDNHNRLMKILNMECKKHGIICNPNSIFSYMHTYESKIESNQLSLF